MFLDTGGLGRPEQPVDEVVHQVGDVVRCGHELNSVEGRCATGEPRTQ